jgi:hypothetical protein
VDREKLRRTMTITKRKKIRRMSKVLNAKNNLPDTFRALEKEWPLSKNDRKLTKKQQDHQDALDNFFKKMDEDMVEQNKFLNRVWSNRAKMPSLYPEKSLTWEARIYYKAFDKADINIGKWFAKMANDKKAIYGAGTGGWLWNKGEKRDLPHLHTFEAVSNFDNNKREYKYFKANVVDMPNEPDKDLGKIIGHVQLYCYVISVSKETLCQSSYTPKKALFPFVVGPLAYNLFHLLYSILSGAEEEEENYWVKLNKEALTYFWNEFKDDGKHKLCCIGELALHFIRVFGRILLTVGLGNIKKMFKLLGMLHDVEDRKVSILSSIVDQSYSTMKKCAALRNNFVFMVSKGIFNHLLLHL